MSKTLFEQVFKSTHIDNLPDGEEKRQGQEVERYFTAMVDTLRRFDAMPSKTINDLMGLFWNLVHYKKVLTASGPVPTLHFWCEQALDGRQFPVVVIPPNFPQMVRDDIVMQGGGMVFVASQAQDFYNGKITRESQKETQRRSWVYEAEYLLTMKYNADRPIEFNDYQKHVLSLFPDGIKSMPPELRYTPKEFTV